LKSYQLALNMQTLKVDYHTQKSFPSLVASILDEEFF
jgi:hypothetical protein